MPVRGGATIRPRWPLPIGRDQVEDARGHVRSALEAGCVLRVERRQVVEEDLLARDVGLLEVDRLDLDQGEVALPFLRRTDLARRRCRPCADRTGGSARARRRCRRGRAGSCSRARAGSRSRRAGTRARPPRRSALSSRSAPAGSRRSGPACACRRRSRPRGRLAIFSSCGIFMSCSARMSRVSLDSTACSSPAVSGSPSEGPRASHVGVASFSLSHVSFLFLS